MAELDYLNFDLQIERSDGGYRGQVLSSPAGEARAALLPLTGFDTTATSQVVGGQLFDAVFHDEILSCLRRSMDETTRQGKGLRIRLRLSTVPDLANLPWEYLYDRSRDNFLALSRETPLVRYLDLPEPPRNLEGQRRLRVLAVIASPSDYPPLDVEHEWANLQQALHDLEARELVIVDRLTPPSLEALQRQLLLQEYHILHFLGHSSFDPQANDSVLVLQGQDGQGQVVTGQDISTLLRDQRSLRLALLNSCQGAETSAQDAYTGVAQRLVRGGTPAVIAMRTAISDQAAVAFAGSFYAALADGAAVDAALAEARKALFTGCCTEEWGTPVLYMRAPDGDLWRQSKPDTHPDRRRLVLVSGLTLAVVLALVSCAYLIFVPARMDPKATLNIAVADIGMLNADGTVQSSPDGRLIRDWITSALEAGNRQQGASSRIAIWHDGLSWTQKRTRLVAPAGKTAQDRDKAAEALAHQIGADVIIYGHLTPDGDGATFVPEFHVSPRVRPEADETIGKYTFGDPIRIPANLSRSDSLAREAVARPVSDRATALFRLLQGLREDLLGQHDTALAVFQQTQADLTWWPDLGAGKEVLYYFLAREALFLKRYGEAEAAAEKATQINPTHPRSFVVLGGARLGRAMQLLPAEQLAPDSPLAGAEAAYTRAVDLAMTDSDRRMELIARVAFASARLVRGAAFYALDDPSQDAEASRWAEQAITELRPLLAALEEINQYRLLGQAYSYLGQAYFQEGNQAQRTGRTDEMRRAFTLAQDAFSSCVALGKVAPEDQTLVVKVIQGICEPRLQDVQTVLAAR